MPTFLPPIHDVFPNATDWKDNRRTYTNEGSLPILDANKSDNVRNLPNGVQRDEMVNMRNSLRPPSRDVVSSNYTMHQNMNEDRLADRRKYLYITIIGRPLLTFYCTYTPQIIRPQAFNPSRLSTLMNNGSTEFPAHNQYPIQERPGRTSLYQGNQPTENYQVGGNFGNRFPTISASGVGHPSGFAGYDYNNLPTSTYPSFVRPLGTPGVSAYSGAGFPYMSYGAGKNERYSSSGYWAPRFRPHFVTSNDLITDYYGKGNLSSANMHFSPGEPRRNVLTPGPVPYTTLTNALDTSNLYYYPAPLNSEPLFRDGIVPPGMWYMDPPTSNIYNAASVHSLHPHPFPMWGNEGEASISASNSLMHPLLMGKDVSTDCPGQVMSEEDHLLDSRLPATRDFAEGITQDIHKVANDFTKTQDGVRERSVAELRPPTIAPPQYRTAVENVAECEICGKRCRNVEEMEKHAKTCSKADVGSWRRAPGSDAATSGKFVNWHTSNYKAFHKK
ncbi:hypothetical protein BDP27DRAFT_1435188 [Rhodocollybia butyracea]|uniref:Uncharacterized protein n=1 Tax=Rhodocollybia butyracea TaxID=206335 RepID=A0A9P5P4P4_9AGAR|nr:hypothetical protein BDP27DRAFT_1435188 [Rhodocollybia butyracea]